MMTKTKTKTKMTTRELSPPPAAVTEEAITRALAEDLGDAGDVTTNGIVPSGALASATLVARGPGRVAGLFVAERVFQRLDPDVRFETVFFDGDDVEAGAAMAHVRGRARALLTAERTALNFVGRLSGIATATRDFRAAIGRTPPEIVDTRKTTPGLRGLEKYAVRVGGGKNHRFGLYDAVLVKDNHIAVAGGIQQALERARERVGHAVKIEVEVETLEQLEELLPLGADAVLLDNMSLDTLRQSVELCRGRLLTEASGGITRDNVREVADTGVDQISVGALTHSVTSLDISLDVQIDVRL